MSHDPLLTTLLDLDAALESQELTIGGGYGLYLKQLYLLAIVGSRANASELSALLR